MTRYLIFVALIQSASIALAQPSANLLAGCASCHGANGLGNTEQQAPALAGQNPDYLAKQLTHFRDGQRGSHPSDTLGQIMAASSAELNNDEIGALARYYGSLPRPSLKSVGQLQGQDIEANEQLYQDTCSRCHGQQAEGYPQLGTPNLALLDAVYLRRQMDNFATGRRGGNANADIRSAWMRSVATHIHGTDELAGVIRYITSIPRIDE